MRYTSTGCVVRRKDWSMTYRRAGTIVGAVVALMSPVAAFAQAVGSVTTAPVQSAPAMGIWFLVVLAVAMVGAAMYRLRRTVATAAVGFVLMSALLAGVGYAVSFITIAGAQCMQNTTNAFDPQEPNVLQSECPNQIEIINIEASCGPKNNPSVNPPTSIKPCKDGQVMFKGDICRLPECD